MQASFGGHIGSHINSDLCKLKWSGDKWTIGNATECTKTFQPKRQFPGCQIIWFLWFKKTEQGLTQEMGSLHEVGGLD